MDSTMTLIRPFVREQRDTMPDFTFRNEMATTRTDLQLSQQSDYCEIDEELRRQLAEIPGVIVI